MFTIRYFTNAQFDDAVARDLPRITTQCRAYTLKRDALAFVKDEANDVMGYVIKKADGRAISDGTKTMNKED